MCSCSKSATKSHIAPPISCIFIYKVIRFVRAFHDSNWLRIVVFTVTVKQSVHSDGLIHTYDGRHSIVRPQCYYRATAEAWRTCVHKSVTCISSEAKPRTTLTYHSTGVTVIVTVDWFDVATCVVTSPRLGEVYCCLTFLRYRSWGRQRPTRCQNLQ